MRMDNPQISKDFPMMYVFQISMLTSALCVFFVFMVCVVFGVLLISNNNKAILRGGGIAGGSRESQTEGSSEFRGERGSPIHFVYIRITCVDHWFDICLYLQFFCC